MLGICLRTEKTPGKSQVDHLMKALQPNGVPYFQMMSVGLNRTSGREKEGNQERVGRVNITECC